MTLRDMNLRVFEGKEIPHIFFQPRLEPWFSWHKDKGLGKLSEKYARMNLIEFYDELGVSMRYTHYATGMPYPVETRYTEKVRVEEKLSDGERFIITYTPDGELIRKTKETTDKAWRTVGFSVKDERDLKKLGWLYENTQFSFNMDDFAKGSHFIGNRGEPQFYLPKSPYQALCQQWMKLEDFIYCLQDSPEKVEEVMKTIDGSYDGLYEQIISSGEVRVVNFGENIDAHFLSPLYFEKYLIPFYEKRSNQLRRAGIYTHLHIDGSFKPLLPYLSELPFDGLEALTPLPQGDVSIEEMKESIGGKVLLDGIPAVLFLPHYPMEELEKCVEKLVELFHPRLILGISDELPEGADEEAIERVRWIADYCRSNNG